MAVSRVVVQSVYLGSIENSKSYCPYIKQHTL